MKNQMSVSLFVLSILTFVALGIGTTAQAQGVEVGDGVVITGRVVSIDRVDRALAILGPKGNVVAIEVGSEVRNFDQIQIGDSIRVAYYESVAIYIGQNGEKPEASAGLVAGRSAKGDKPAGIIAEIVDVSAKVEGIDKAKRIVSLELPDRRVVTTKVDPSVKGFDTLKVGSTIHVRYTEAIAISVDKP